MPGPPPQREGRAFKDGAHAGRAWRSGLLALAGFMGLGMLATAAGAAAAPGGTVSLARHGGSVLVAWVLLGVDVLPGVAAWLVWRRQDVGLHRKRAALRLWGWGLPGRALWAATAGATQGGAHAAAELAAIAVLGGLTLLCIRAFWPLQRFAAAMLLPYMACIGVAAWLGASI